MGSPRQVQVLIWWSGATNRKSKTFFLPSTTGAGCSRPKVRRYTIAAERKLQVTDSRRETITVQSARSNQVGLCSLET